MENLLETPAKAPKKERRTREVPRVAVYSRHADNCKNKGDQTKNSCGCPKSLQWYDGKLYREACGTTDWLVAEKQCREKQERFEKQAAGEPVPEPKKNQSRTLTSVIDMFIETKQKSEGSRPGKHITEKHIERLRYETRAFADFLAARGIFNLADITTADCQFFSNNLGGALSYRRKRVQRVTGLLEFAVEMDFIKRNPAKVKAVRIKGSSAQKPRALDDKQFAQLLDAISLVNGRTTPEQRAALRSLCLLQRWSGLAIRDAVTIERSKFADNGDGFFTLQVCRAKTEHPVFAMLKADIVAEIFAGARPEGKYLFVEDRPTEEKALDTLIKKWGELYAKLGDVVELKDAEGQPYAFSGSHALRHSFALWALNSGMPMEDLAELLGDSLETTATSYACWVPDRQKHLKARMRAALTAGLAVAATA